MLFLTGRSGSGKTSLLHAHVLPRLREQEPPVRIIILRGYQGPVEALSDKLLGPGVIWKERPPADAPDIETLVAKACAHLRPARLLVVFDQFEELLILHEQDVERREAIEQLSEAVEAGRLSGISLLFVLRSDYLGKLQELALPRLRQGDNWHEISPFTEHAARAFLTDSGLQPGPRLLDQAMRQARRAEETQGLIRPITVNMIGIILERITSGDDPRLPRERGGLLVGYLRRALAAPELRDHAPRLLTGMLSEAGTKRPRSVAELATETQSSEATVRACLLLLGNQGIVRPLDDAADVWEISHDFVARLLVGVLAAWHARLWKRLRPWIAPLLLVPAFGLLLMPANRDALAFYAIDGAGAEMDRDTDGANVFMTIGEDFQMDPKEFRARLDDLEGSLHIHIEGPWAEFGPVLSGMTRLQSLDLSYTQVSDLTPLAGLSGLQTLKLTQCWDVSDLRPLSDLSGLRSLILNRTQVSDLAPLSGLSGLQTLYLDDTQVSDLAPLSGLSGLQRLYLDNTQVSDLAPLSGLSGLQRLSLDGTQVSDLANLSEVSGLQRLNLIRTPVSDLAPLSGLSGLQRLDLRGTQVTQAGMAELKKALPNCFILGP